MRNKLLIGTWSIDCLYYPGAQEDTILVFNDDGTGMLKYMNSATSEIDTFIWQYSGSDSITIVGKDYICNDEKSRSSLSCDNISFSIDKYQSPVYGEILKVTFETPIWLNQSEFGLLSDDPNYFDIEV